MVTHQQLFIVSQDIYKAPDPNKPNDNYRDAHDAGFTLLKTSGKTDSSTGFFAGIFHHEASDTIVIAFRGSNDFNDWSKNNPRIATDNMPIQYKEAQAFIEEAQAAHPGKTIILTGHSGGAASAQLAALWSGLKAVTWECPALAKIARNYFTKTQIKNVDITDYVGPENPVTAGEHITPTLRLNVNVNLRGTSNNPFGFGKNVGLAHSMETLAK